MRKLKTVFVFLTILCLIFAFGTMTAAATENSAAEDTAVSDDTAEPDISSPKTAIIPEPAPVPIPTPVPMPAPEPVPEGTYTDTVGHWAEDAIEEWSEYGIIHGFEGKFRPDDSITRAEMAAIIQRTMAYQVTAENTFVDVPADAWYEQDILKLNAAGIMLGNGIGNMYPQNTITRQEAIVMLSRCFGFESWSSTGVLPYTDAANISSWAMNAVSVMTERGYLSWAGTEFQPNKPITRAEIMATLDGAITKIWTSNGFYSTVVEGSALIRASKVYLMNCNIGGNVIIPGNAEDVVVEHCQLGGSVINPCAVKGGVLDINTGEIANIYYGSSAVPILHTVPKNTYMSADFAKINGRTTYIGSDAQTRAGIDVSEWQADIDWPAVANDGLDFVMIRLGWRGYEAGGLNLDEKYFTNIEAALALGMDVGVYVFSQAITVEEAIEEAELCIKNLEGYDITYPVVFDWETVGSSSARTNNMDGTLLTDCAIAFCETIADAGYTPMIYSNKQLALLSFELDRLTDYAFWFAGYTTYPEYYYAFDMWQYTSEGSVAGIKGNVDMNIEFIK